MLIIMNKIYPGKRKRLSKEERAKFKENFLVQSDEIVLPDLNGTIYADIESASYEESLLARREFRAELARVYRRMLYNDKVKNRVYYANNNTLIKALKSDPRKDVVWAIAKRNINNTRNGCIPNKSDMKDMSTIHGMDSTLDKYPTNY